jgi:hypothetical protein
MHMPRGVGNFESVHPWPWRHTFYGVPTSSYSVILTSDVYTDVVVMLECVLEYKYLPSSITGSAAI